MNQDLKQLHETLMAQQQALYDKLDTTTDPNLAKSIITEMQEILHRVDILQGLLFKETTASLSSSLQKVDSADTELTAALKTAQSAADYVKGVSNFLGFVDKAIDLAKTLAPMAV
jgi:hypothetical protein